MSENSNAVKLGRNRHKPSSQAIAAKKKLSSGFMKKGISLALFSGVTYGIWTACLTMGMTKGVWGDWYGANTAGLSAFVIAYVLAALGNAINDTCSAVWALLYALKKGKFGDFVRCLNSKPGRIIMVAALIGGPVAGTAYVIALQMAGSIVVPISALCPAIAAILGKILYNQEINKRMAVGIFICVSASFLIGSTGFTGGETSPTMFLGIGIAILAALGWGFEGCVAGYGSVMVDPEIGICIRQVTSGIANLFILVPIFGIFAGGIDISIDLATQAFTSGPAMIWFALSGLLSVMTFMTWYAGNSMCGAGLGTACNGTYSFFGPLFCLLLLGVYGGQEGWSLPPVVWVGAVIMMFGILTISMNPFDLLKKKFRGGIEYMKPLNYAILKHFTKVDEASAEDVIIALNKEYSSFKALNKKDVMNALMTAEANGLLEETGFELNKNDELVVYYHAHAEGAEIINKYIRD